MVEAPGTAPGSGLLITQSFIAIVARADPDDGSNIGAAGQELKPCESPLFVDFPVGRRQGTRMFKAEDDIHHLGEGLLACSLRKEEWTHAAHFAAALWLMRYRPDIDPARDMPGLIRRFNESLGGVNSDTTGYHETITQASLRAARGVLDFNAPDVPVFQIANALMASSLGNPNWLLEYWSLARLMSVDARRAWLEPDLKPLPFQGRIR